MKRISAIAIAGLIIFALIAALVAPALLFALPFIALIAGFGLRVAPSVTARSWGRVLIRAGGVGVVLVILAAVVVDSSSHSSSHRVTSERVAGVVAPAGVVPPSHP